MATIFVNENRFDNVRIAVTKSEQEIGLMGSNWPPDMLLFVYKTANIRKFWMKDTPTPLDIIFCLANRVIYVGKGEPFNTVELVGPDQNCNLVLEVPHGFADFYDMKVGSKVRIRYSKNELEYIVKNGSPLLEING